MKCSPWCLAGRVGREEDLRDGILGISAHRSQNLTDREAKKATTTTRLWPLDLTLASPWLVTLHLQQQHCGHAAKQDAASLQTTVLMLTH